MTVERWWWFLVFSLVAFIVLCTFLIYDGAQSQGTAVCVTQEEKDQLEYLTREATEQAYREYIGKLFQVWVTSAKPEPDQARVGVQNGISAFIRARRDIEKWSPPPC